MMIAHTCGKCGHSGNVDDRFAGRSLRCPKCGAETLCLGFTPVDTGPPPLRPTRTIVKVGGGCLAVMWTLFALGIFVVAWAFDVPEIVWVCCKGFASGVSSAMSN